MCVFIFKIIFPSFSSLNSSLSCNSVCHCDYVRYMPVCGEDQMTYISPCHAGCKKEFMDLNGRKVCRGLCTIRIYAKFYYFVFSLIMIVPVYPLL